MIYDDALRLVDLNATIDAGAGPRVTFGYDAANRLTGITRNEDGGGNKVHSVFGYDYANRLTTITHASTVAGQLSQMIYGYDNANRLSEYTGPEGLREYEYDDTNQLLKVWGWKSIDPIEEFTYDLAGNRTMAGYSTTTGNRMSADGTYTYTYDHNGNTSQRTKVSNGAVTDYAWDYRNRLTNIKERASLGGTVTYEATYTYDVFDRRIGILEDADGAGGGVAVQTWTVYDGANAWADFAANGSLTMRYLNGYGMDERYARIAANGDVRWYLTDLVNSVRQIVQSNGNVVWSASYSAFGMILNPSGAGGDRFKYTGREWDAGTGQYYYRARYYGADVGRFRSEDPIGFAAGDVNLFRYVGNQPTFQIDPAGLQGTRIIFGRDPAGNPIAMLPPPPGGVLITEITPNTPTAAFPAWLTPAEVRQLLSWQIRQLRRQLANAEAELDAFFAQVNPLFRQLHSLYLRRQDILDQLSKIARQRAILAASVIAMCSNSAFPSIILDELRAIDREEKVWNKMLQDVNAEINQLNNQLGLQLINRAQLLLLMARIEGLANLIGQKLQELRDRGGIDPDSIA